MLALPRKVLPLCGGLPLVLLLVFILAALAGCDVFYMENPFVAGDVILGNTGKPQDEEEDSDDSPAPDTEDPVLGTVSYSPEVGGQINGITAISGTATDNRGLSKVEVAVVVQDGDPAGSYSTASLAGEDWTLSVDTYPLTASNQFYADVYIRAVDTAGNTAEEQKVKYVDQFDDDPS